MAKSLDTSIIIQSLAAAEARHRSETIVPGSIVSSLKFTV